MLGAQDCSRPRNLEQDLGRLLRSIDDRRGEVLGGADRGFGGGGRRGCGGRASRGDDSANGDLSQRRKKIARTPDEVQKVPHTAPPQLSYSDARTHPPPQLFVRPIEPCRPSNSDRTFRPDHVVSTELETKIREVSNTEVAEQYQCQRHPVHVGEVTNQPPGRLRQTLQRLAKRP